jgi:tRNA pseudouridine38-40 synthase
MQRNFKIIIEYDGSAFHGWQIQPGKPTIQSEIQTILHRMTQENIVIHGSGRTDAGVHALGQVAHFFSHTRISPEQFQAALNQMLPAGIVIKECRYVEDSFHARFSAKRKTYRYRILNRQVPLAVGRQYLWHIWKKLDINAMQQAADRLIGTHDFKSFEGTGSPRASTVRQIDRAEFKKDGDMIIFEITANGFLKFMVRNIVGTLVD